MIKEDRRIQRTHRALEDSLLALTWKQGYESISIRELTDHAGVGYATFFRHYKSKEELLVGMLTALVDDFMSLMPDVGELTGAEDKGLVLFRYVEEHADLCRLLLGSQGSSSMALELHRLSTEKTIASLEQFPLPAVSMPLPVIANHIVASVFAMVRWWLDHGQPHPPEEMAVMYAKLIFSSLEVVFGDKGSADSPG